MQRSQRGWASWDSAGSSSSLQAHRDVSSDGTTAEQLWSLEEERAALINSGFFPPSAACQDVGAETEIKHTETGMRKVNQDQVNHPGQARGRSPRGGSEAPPEPGADPIWTKRVCFL